MLRAGALAVAAGAVPPRAPASRRLAWGLLASLLFHALLLSLHFGVPGMALQGARSSINITLAQVIPPVPQPHTDALVPDPVPAPPPPPRPKAGSKSKPRKAPPVSAPLPRPEADTPVRVIAQASNPASEFVVPLPQPEDAVQKTIDPAEAQHGSDALAQAAQEPPALPELQQPALLGDDAAARQLQREADDARLAAIAARELEVLAQQRVAQELAERRKLEELLAQQRLAQALMERQKSEELLAQQRRDMEQAERRRLEEMAARQLADERARHDAAREREAAIARAAPPGDPFGVAGGQGGSGRSKGTAGNYGSDLSNRVRDLSKGLDLLTGAPPARARPDHAGQSRRVVANSAERDVPLRMYVESWRQKIERNGSMNFPTLIGERARIDPLVSVAVRSDGSIEDVTIVRSSGRQDTDDAVRRIVRINALYSSFPPNIASRYDVIEIRRIWTFDQVLKLVEEVR